MKENRFDEFFSLLMQLEGGYSNVDGDRGGKTKYGITEKTYGAPVEKLTLSDAKDFYLKNFYNKVEYVDKKEVHYNYFDLCVNSGFSYYKKCVLSGDDVYKYRENLYNKISKQEGQEKFLKGWLNRLWKIKRYFNVS